MQDWKKPNEVSERGRYLFETTGGDLISREHEITEKDGELGVYLEATRKFVKLIDFRSDCHLRFIK
jgi:hypothetical protein